MDLRIFNSGVMKMKVILKEDLEGLGKTGDLVDVRDGYARNYLIPKNLAVEASKKNLRQLEHEKRMISVRENKRLKTAQALAQRLSELSISIPCKVGEADKLFGAVTALDIVEALKKEGFEIDKRQIKLDEPLKSLGVYTVTIHLTKDVDAHLKVWLVKQ